MTPATMIQAMRGEAKHCRSLGFYATSVALDSLAGRLEGLLQKESAKKRVPGSVPTEEDIKVYQQGMQQILTGRSSIQVTYPGY